jgi:FAD binding domain
MAAVRFAREGGLGVGVMATGHGVGAACDGGVLINTSRMRGVRVDPVDRTARVEAGALWTDLIHECQVHSLAGLLGSTSQVGIVGYTMGGGFGWLGRKYGFNAASVKEADVVTADGELVRVSAEEHPDLFWGLGGGVGNFGAGALGQFVPVLWLGVLGASIATTGTGADPAVIIVETFGALAVPVLFLVLHGPIATNILNVYSMSVSALAVDVRVRRHVLALAVGVLATAFTIYLVFVGSLAEQLDAWLVGVVAWGSP